jgi:urease alpha subunit
MEALRLYTVGSAWFSSEEEEKGSIEEGKLADLAVLSADYFSVAEEQIKRIESVLTMVDGKVVYGAGDFGKLAPPPLPTSPDWSPTKIYGGYHSSASSASSISSRSCAHEAHRHPFVLSSSGELWRLGCDCFAF